ncbi:MAG TPA: hypothetical protein HA348_02855 [Thermoplasmata archaeon]|nr:hypothetical protein [Thermoplasmata archaeon]
MQSPKIPKTGRLGQWVKAMEDEGVSQSVIKVVMQNVNQFTSTSNPAEKAEWIKDTTERLENSVGKKICIQVMEKKGRICCGATLRSKAKKFMKESKSIKEFLKKLNSMRGYTFELKDNHTIVGEYDKCYCGLVNKTKKPFKNLTYCHCGVGHIKQFFESALEKPIEVELVQSVITGAESCKFIIHI